ncbi:MFS transporter [Listeria sp. FSL L7-1485]|uniref:MFS transporter n=1 Tax=Listeria immobilis TaxID=2713502 RepID=A0A7X1C992_9LIST|nr:MFS transporter [Listeria immobilis]MBC1483097.1 MFS transporter [Listeria immobilis]MBC1489079.1 MFS transporter [Listeria immobilis]MBC1507103.1 MFS transporter [Listeria immobilis]MBC1509537.1 MFS transporter [Listeria immobilis]MBC1515657.1 MFS transporter [Listeria immobilis]
MKNKYLSTSLGLYMNYFVHGMALIIIAQNIDFLSQKWNTDIAGAAGVVSSFGIGKLLAVFVSGKLSDKFGRKLSVILGVFFYIVFLGGILLSPNTIVAYAFGISAGIANSFLDTGTYPALMEAYPKKAASANIVVKAFVQAGQFLLPFMIAFILANNLWYGWSFIVLIAILLINLLYTLTRHFPPMTVGKPLDLEKEVAQEKWSKIHFSIDELCLILFGFVAQTLLYIISQWIAKYGSEVIHMTDNASRLLVSYASVGAILCVCVTFILGNRGVKTLYILITYVTMTMLISFVLFAFPNEIICLVGAFLLGYFSAGGIIQLGLTLLAEVSARGKGFVTSLYTIAEGIAVFSIPLIAAAISRIDIAAIFLLNSGIALFGLILLMIVFVRKRKFRRDTI